MKGDSLRRQIEAAESYARTHGLHLDDQLTFQDLGVSAFRGANVETGRLGDFLQAIRFKDIAPGSYLIVESLDRLSRRTPRKAVRMLEEICEAGITVVTLDDGREYTEEIIDKDPTALLVALLVAARANEESLKKARRLSAAWEQKRKEAKDKPLTSVCPAWLNLHPDRTHFEIVDERAEIIRRIYEDTLQGMGQHSIAQELNKKNVPVFGRGKIWHRSYVSKLLANPAVIGTYIPHSTQISDGKRRRFPLEPIPNYYPAIIEKDVFERVSVMASGRGAGKGRSGRVSSILAGLATCPSCKSTMTRVNKGRKGGQPYLVCTIAKAGGPCSYKQVSLDNIQDAVIDDVEFLNFDLPPVDAQLNEHWHKLLNHIQSKDVEIDNLIRAIETTGHSKSLLARLAELEGVRNDISEEFDILTSRIGNALSNRIKDTLAELIGMCGNRPSNIPHINATLRQLFTRVEIDYLRGELNFCWRHSDHVSSIMYGLPELE